MIKTAILTISDKGSQGDREDKSGEVIEQVLAEIGAEKISYGIIPDDFEIIKTRLCELSSRADIELILTTGGTGLAERDLTPEATKAIIEKEVPGIPEKIRYQTSSITPFSYLSRSVAGVRDSTLIINLPGSPKAVEESLEAIVDIIPHGLDILLGRVGEH